MNHILKEGESISGTEVSMVTLDSLVEGKSPILMKIDVEGYEMSVLRGAETTLGCSELEAIIVEMNGSAERYGHGDLELLEMLNAHGFSRYCYDPFKRSLEPKSGSTERTGNALFVRNSEFVARRLESATKFAVMGETL
jgi:hypothetical protein